MMDIDKTAKQKLKALSACFGIDLEIKTIWEDEYAQGFYFRFYGLVCHSPLLKVEIAGSYSFRIKNNDEEEEIDIFPFINNKRVSPCNSEEYIWKTSNGLKWDCIDMGYDNKLTLKELLLDRT
jgi:hypothetical protein